jgi:protein phosphatase
LQGGDNGPKEQLHQLFLNHLLRPKEWSASVDGQTYFAFRREHILALADEARKILESQPMVLKVEAPIKVFGDVHG